MIEKFIRFTSKHLNSILIASTVFFLSGTGALIFKWCKQANTFGDNILIEFFVGGLFLIIPLLFGIFLGNKQKELQFYDRIKNLVKTIKRLRVNQTITELAARELVSDFSTSLGEEILEEDWLKNVIRKDFNFSKQKCGICNLESDVVNERCTHCKLNCFAWKE